MWIYLETRKGVYGLTQYGNLANNLLTKRLNAAGYYHTLTTSGLWRHKWIPITLCLIVDNFGVKYFDEQHAHHLKNFLK